MKCEMEVQLCNGKKKEKIAPLYKGSIKREEEKEQQEEEEESGVC